MKTVLILAPNVSPYPGGAESYITDLMNGLINYGYKVICATENPPENNKSEIEYLKISADINRIKSPVTVKLPSSVSVVFSKYFASLSVSV